MPAKRKTKKATRGCRSTRTPQELAEFAYRNRTRRGWRNDCDRIWRETPWITGDDAFVVSRMMEALLDEVIFTRTGGTARCGGEEITEAELEALAPDVIERLLPMGDFQFATYMLKHRMAK
jgi:hypothetical protein